MHFFPHSLPLSEPLEQPFLDGGERQRLYEEERRGEMQRDRDGIIMERMQ